MEVVMDANAVLDYIEFQISPSQNRYEANVCYLNKKPKKVASGLVEHLLLHSAEINALHSKGSDAKYKLKPPRNPLETTWFTEFTLERFLLTIGAPKILDITNTIRREISQLEDARRFHLSLHSNETEYQPQNGESDSSSYNGMTSTLQIEGSDGFKNELLRAIDLRISALRRQLMDAFDRTIDSGYSIEELTDLEKFSYHFGSMYLRDCLHNRVEFIKNQAVNTSNSAQFLKSGRNHGEVGDTYCTKSLSSETPVNYGASPAKVAQEERHNSSNSEESSLVSEEEPTQVERSRDLIRAASPRRSASPMRRVQIGRSGSRRSTAIGIKSLSYITPRERSFLPRNSSASGSDEEGPKKEPKKSENNLRISVQDAISLFERKQKDQTGDIQNLRSSMNSSTVGNKSVLRRWSSGIGEHASQNPEDTVLEDVSRVQSNAESREITSSSPKTESQPGVASGHCTIDHGDMDINFHSLEKTVCSPACMPEGSLPSESTNFGEKIAASAEWNRKTEAELNELMMEIVKTKPMKCRTVVRDSNRRQSLPIEQRGGFYNSYQAKREEKLRGETARNKGDKAMQYRPMQQTLVARKSELNSANKSDAGQKQHIKKLQKSQQKAAPSANTKTDSPKLDYVKKASVKASSLPPTRKSWPSAPSPTTSRTSLANNSTGATQTFRSQPVPPVSRPSKKIETPQPLHRSVKSNENSAKKSLRHTAEKQQQAVAKPIKTTQIKVQNATEKPVSSGKPSLYNKVTRKGSVVPLESKLFLRKGSGTVPTANPVTNMKHSSEFPEPLENSEDPILVEESNPVSNSFEPTIQHQESESETHIGIESEICATCPSKCEDKEKFNQVYPASDYGIVRVVEPELEVDVEEESTISPTAWVEIEKHEDRTLILRDDIYDIGIPANIPVKVSNPRVRHSLSQMLLEENGEPDAPEWGNAENPPAMGYQKDAPKGFKRLLKFARKGKTDASTTGWLSPTVFSEGEDDCEDSKFANRRSAENLLKIATLQSKNNGHPKADANISKSNSQGLSQHLQEGYASASVTTAKATRSFFSLSAFKSSK